MPFPDDLLNPIEEAKPSGVNLRYTLYDVINEARREEKVPPPGMAEADRKVADNKLVIKLSTEALTKQTKDLWLAAWLTEALVKEQGFPGLRDGLALCQGLLEKFWDTLYPEIEDGDLEPRTGPLEFVGKGLDVAVRNVPIVAKQPYGLADCLYARDVVKYERETKTADDKKTRAERIAAGRVTPEDFDKYFEGSPKVFYVDAEKSLDQCLQILDQLRGQCEARFPVVDARPSMVDLRETLERTRQVVHGLLQKKREKEPDPVEEKPPEAAAEAAPGAGVESAAPGPVRTGVLISLETSSEPPDRLEAIRKIADSAAFLRRREPRSPASYLMLRGLRWGELRAAVDRSDPTPLEAPPTELRKHLKRLALDKKWEELLEAAESAMALPCSRAWLDLQRFLIEACQALGSDYEAVARAIRSELKALVTDIPQLLDATLMDDTPVANAETRAWLKSLCQEAPSQATTAEPSTGTSLPADGFASRWPGQPTDLYVAALQALRDGQERKAFEILQKDIARQRSGRERFRRKMQLVEMCVSTNKQNIAQPILDDLAAAIETHKLDDWEDPGLVAGALATIMKLSQRIQNDAAQRQKLFERICRLDPAQALGDGK
ncbi:MAG TPA: type VI secretion system protein TssA [Terriglobia bacterium]|nr:type VI secretion system protein TssA [Terriglobia bacterium]